MFCVSKQDFRENTECKSNWCIKPKMKKNALIVIFTYLKCNQILKLVANKKKNSMFD